MGAAAVIVLVLIELSVIFHKAGLPFWGSVVPIYNRYLIAKDANRSGWWVLLCLIPVVGVLFTLNVLYRISKGFGHGIFFMVGIVVLTPIFLGWIAFSGDRYLNSASSTSSRNHNAFDWGTSS